MSQTTDPTLLGLPIKIIHRILGNLGLFDILVSLHSVCAHLDAIIDNYLPYQVTTAFVLKYSSRTSFWILSNSNPDHISKIESEMRTKHLTEISVRVPWSIFSVHRQCEIIHIFPQTLETLNLHENHIGSQGIQQLAEALRQNTVSLILTSPVMWTDRHLFSRQSQHSTSAGIKSGRWRQNIWQMSYLITRWPSRSSHRYHELIETFTHRHSQHSFSIIIGSETKDQSILPMHCLRTRYDWRTMNLSIHIFFHRNWEHLNCNILKSALKEHNI